MFAKLLKYAGTILARSRIYSVFDDFSEMRNRFYDAFRGLYMPQCRETTGPLVSIVIPTRNESARLPILLSSIRASCYRNTEVIVADFKSTDDTPEIARKMGARVVKLDKPGVGYATFAAVKESRGDIIIRTDADTIFPRNIIKIAVDMLAKKNKLVAHVGHVYYDAGFIENAVAFYYDKYLRELWHTTGHFIAFKKEVVERGVNFDPRELYNDDWVFGEQVYKKFGSSVFTYDYKPSILVSARRIRKTGLLKYVLGFRTR